MANRLKDATSPYLLQHADNPVDWYEWGEEALRRARDEDRPILLSVGYAACHWCHVMERESFEDEETARLMNEHFVSVKVDREERPDVDAIYMDAVQAMTGHGGWPMTVFLGPDGRPFFAGTYFPPEDRHGIPSFRKVLTAVAQAWRNEREKLLEQGERVTAAISRRLAPSPEPLTEQTLRDAVTGLAASFDEEWGGFGAAPKFPQPMTIEFLLRRHRRGDDEALAMATRTLDRMSAGGMHDQIGGGFHRYSTDREWRVPHFEKMLYDNALLARAYLHAYQVTGAARYREVCATTLDYVLNDLRHADGGLFSSQDADSEGVEGKFYAWTWPELVDVAGEEAARRFGGSPEGNWGGESGTEPAVVLLDAWADIGDELAFHQDRAATEGYLETRSRLVEARGGRPHPATDDKVIAAWNGLAIQALAEAGRALDEPRFVAAAERAAEFVLTRLARDDGRLLRAWRDGRAGGPGFADDYACMAAACLTLYETTFDLRWFTETRRLADELVRLFHDVDDGGFFQTGADADPLVTRPKDLFDNAVPSGSSVAAEVLLRLSLLTGEASYESTGVSALRAVHGLLTRTPSMFGHALGALDLYLGTSKEIAVVGTPDADDTRVLIETVWRRFEPSVVLAAAADGDEEAQRTVPLLADRDAVDGTAAAYVCERFVCRRPVTQPDELAALLS
jgi:uncharacterized protein YyaL (SSP411 family)